MLLLWKGLYFQTAVVMKFNKDLSRQKSSYSILATDTDSWTQISNSILIQDQTGGNIHTKTTVESSYQKFPLRTTP